MSSLTVFLEQLLRVQVRVPFLARSSQFGLERTTASPVEPSGVSYLLPMEREVSLARRRRLCLKEKHPCPSSGAYLSSSTSSASSSTLFALSSAPESSSCFVKGDFV